MFQRHPIQNDEFMFITTNVQGKRRVFDDPAFAEEAVHNLYRVQKLHPFILHGFVVMPDHCHFLMYVPYPETISRIMRVYKYGLTFQLGIGAFWQSRFHLIIPKDGERVLHYIHNNPVKAGLALKPEDYRWSSASGVWGVAPLEW